MRPVNLLSFEEVAFLGNSIKATKLVHFRREVNLNKKKIYNFHTQQNVIFVTFRDCDDLFFRCIFCVQVDFFVSFLSICGRMYGRLFGQHPLSTRVNKSGNRFAIQNIQIPHLFKTNQPLSFYSLIQFAMQQAHRHYGSEIVKEKEATNYHFTLSFEQREMIAVAIPFGI